MDYNRAAIKCIGYQGNQFIVSRPQDLIDPSDTKILYRTVLPHYLSIDLA